MKLFAASVAGTIGVAAAIHYHQLGLTLSHYDARGHLIVARRIIDSITPGWQQIGAVWLPLPHLLNMLPVQVDAFYRSGASAVAVSVLSFVIATAAIAWLVQLLTNSKPAALAAAAVFALNPNLVYLQATPMTEPLLLALMTAGVAMVMRNVGDPERVAQATATVGIVLALACLTRYEAWPVTYAALAAAVWTRWRNNDSLPAAVRAVLRVAVYPTAAILAFSLFSRVVVGQWFVSSDFFVPENKAQGMPLVAIKEIVWGTRELSGQVLTVLGVIGCLALLLAGLFTRRRAAGMIALSLGATAAVPWAAFIDGHPFRIRYMVPLIALEAVAVGALIEFVARPFQGRGRGGAGETIDEPKRIALRTLSIVVIAIALYELHPFDRNAPMVVEAQWDLVNQAPRRQVTQCLQAKYRGESVMASMGSLGHYMQEAARDGFNVRDFLHEGNGDIWLAALDSPHIYAGWIMMEEKAEGGDMLYKRAREHPDFLRGYSRVCEGAGLALYERQNRISNVNR
ncbi:MAG TPA: hypothetical protein VFP91_16455 [Vicinamibacterales bacterium]|nr:hypothetical protein [Vicinamibacterales bacterium]